MFVGFIHFVKADIQSLEQFGTFLLVGVHHLQIYHPSSPHLPNFNVSDGHYEGGVSKSAIKNQAFSVEYITGVYSLIVLSYVTVVILGFDYVGLCEWY